MPNLVYSLLMTLVAALLPFKLWWRGRKQADYLLHWGDRYGYYQQTTRLPLIWLHCVSVGETRAAQPLVQALLAAYPQHAILISHGTPTGRETSGQLFKQQIADGRILQAYLPVDMRSAARRFFTHFQPQLGMLMETELWFNLLAEARARNLPMALLSARLSEKSARGYARLGRLTRDGLQSLALIAAQTDADALRLQALGADHVIVCGNLKFDVTPPADSQAQGDALRMLLGSTRRVLMAASTREGEEALILDALDELDTSHIPDLLTLIVPRHPQRFAEVEALLKARGIRYALRSTLNTPLSPEVKVVLGNSMGEMYTYYAASDVAVIGGSLQPLGGQNLIEAAAMGVPVILGPHMFNFAQVTQAAVEAGAALPLTDVSQLGAQLESLLSDSARLAQMSEAARGFIASHRGTTQRLMQQIQVLLHQLGAG